MPYTPLKLYEGQPGTSNGTLYTVPTVTVVGSIGAIQSVIVKQIHICNTTGTAATITLNIVGAGGSVAVANEILAAESIAANSHLDVNLSQVLSPGDFIAGLQGTSVALTVLISGVKQT